MVSYVGAHDPCEACCPKAEHSQGQPLWVSEGHENYGWGFHGYLINTVSNIKQSNIN